MPDNLVATATAPRKLTRRKYQQLPHHERQRLQRTAANAYATGDSIRTVAAAIGYSYGTTHRILNDADVTLRQHGGLQPYRHDGGASAEPPRQQASQ